jgi:hypothetical protein
VATLLRDSGNFAPKWVATLTEIRSHEKEEASFVQMGHDDAAFFSFSVGFRISIFISPPTC